MSGIPDAGSSYQPDLAIALYAPSDTVVLRKTREIPHQTFSIYSGRAWKDARYI